LIFRIQDLVADISRFLELAPGDIISTGTPGGIGAKRQPPMYLASGDLVEVEVAGVGTIRSVIA
jgi:2-keto-4-pentenoate hydratase/2-oxohepta-3-ene-1,7-dioic acid hydratase in catechol pathway